MLVIGTDAQLEIEPSIDNTTRYRVELLKINGQIPDRCVNKWSG